MSPNRNEIKFKYVYADNYNPAYINGAHGGLTPRGELVVNFYLERLDLPSSITHELLPNGALGSEVSQEPADTKNSLVRFIESGIVLSYENARIIHGWLGERIKEMEALEKAKATAQLGQAAYTKDVTH